MADEGPRTEPAEPSIGAAADRLAPEDAFALLGNELRIAVLHALKRADGPLRFAELRERVGVRDSGQFNYHLGKLTGHFVRKVEAADGGAGYELTLAGEQVVGAILAGTYTASPAIEPIVLDEPCPRCGGDIVAEYADELVHMACSACDDWHNEFPFPPSMVDALDREALPLAFDRWIRTTLARVVDGFCPTCTGRLAGGLVARPDHPYGVAAVYRCPQCGDEHRIGVVGPLLFHPAFVAFTYAHGLDVRAHPTWRLPGLIDQRVTVLDRDPLSVEVVSELDGDRLVVQVDEDLAVEVVEGDAVDG